MSKEFPALLRHLREELNYDVRPGPSSLGYELFYIDLSSWKLRLSNRTLVIWAKSADVQTRSPQHLADSLHDVIRERHLRRDPVLVLVDGASKPIRSALSSPLQPMVIIGSDEQEHILHSRRPTGELRDLISAQLPISTLAPYETAAPITGSRFFGRDYEISKILANLDTNHIILGIRRIGKTSLLKEIERHLREDKTDLETPHIVYLDCSDLLNSDDYIQAVVHKLNPKELPRLHLQNYSFYFPDFLERMQRMHKSKIIFLLDEIDNLIIMQHGRWELFRMLRASSNKGPCQYIMAGFREAMQARSSQETPFFNFAQEIRLNEFNRQQAQDLIVIPMENLGVHFKNKDDVVGRIYQETAGHPNLIQYYCTILLRRLDQTGEREIGPNSLIDVYRDEGFKNHLLTSFMQNTKNREKTLVYALLRETGGNRSSGFTQAYMDAALRKRGVNLTQSAIEESCNVLKLAGILYQKGKDFDFTSPVFTKVLQQTHDLDFLFRKAKEEGV